MTPFGKYCKAKIENAGVTQKQIGKRSGVGEKTLDVFFNDRDNISAKNLKAILEAIEYETATVKSVGQKIEGSYILGEIERIAKSLPEDLQQIAHDQLKALELHYYRRHIRR